MYKVYKIESLKENNCAQIRFLKLQCTRDYHHIHISHIITTNHHVHRRRRRGVITILGWILEFEIKNIKEQQC